VNDLNQPELYEREKRTEGVGIDIITCDECKTLTACSGSATYQGVVGRTLAELKGWWPEPVQETVLPRIVVYKLSLPS
jgi:hypothetical protein